MKWETADFSVDSPTEVLSLYSERLFGNKDWDKLDVDSLRTLFVHLLSDFYDDGINLDMLTLVANMINDLVVDKSDDHFIDILMAAHELNYLIRRVGADNNDGSQLIKNLSDLKKYYFDNKSKIK